MNKRGKTGESAIDRAQRIVDAEVAMRKENRLAREAKDKLYNEQLAKSVPYRPGSKKVRSSITNLDNAR